MLILAVGKRLRGKNRQRSSNQKISRNYGQHFSLIIAQHHRRALLQMFSVDQTREAGELAVEAWNTFARILVGRAHGDIEFVVPNLADHIPTFNFDAVFAAPV